MLQVTEEDPQTGGRRAKQIYVGIAYLALAFSITWSLVQPEVTPRPGLTLGLSAAAAVWLGGFPLWWPNWLERRVWAIAGYLGLLALNTGLMASSEAFTAFVWIGYPFAFAIFPARWAVFAGWYAEVENEKRKKAITQLTDANRRLASAMEENAGLHAQLLVQPARQTCWTSASGWRARSTTPWRRNWLR